MVTLADLVVTQAVCQRSGPGIDLQTSHFDIFLGGGGVRERSTVTHVCNSNQSFPFHCYSTNSPY